jgi:hypothetical protein
MIKAVESVRERMLRATATLAKADVPYAVVGGHAVTPWVARIDRSAVRNTPDVDILICRTDFERACDALLRAGFVYDPKLGVDVFHDAPEAADRDAVHILYAGERFRPDDAMVAPNVDDVEVGAEFRYLRLEALVRMKLTSYRLKDRVQLLDMIDVGLVDATWPSRFSRPLDARLQELLDNPDG